MSDPSAPMMGSAVSANSPIPKIIKSRIASQDADGTPSPAGRGGRSHSAAAAYGSLTAASFHFGVAALQSVLFLQHMFNGLLAGTYYLLIALGLSLIFSLGGIVNLAHGAFYAIGAYLTVVLSPTIGFGGSIVASPILVGILGVVIERTLFRRFYKADPSYR